MHFTKVILVAAVAAGLGATGFAALAQKDPKVGVTVNDPIGPMPDPTRVGMTLPKDIKCTGTEGKQQMCMLYGDVVSGTWWTSSSTVYDERTTYPVHAGTVAVDKLKGIHWDGARTGEKEPAILELVGMGPVKTIKHSAAGRPGGRRRPGSRGKRTSTVGCCSR